MSDGYFYDQRHMDTCHVAHPMFSFSAHEIGHLLLNAGAEKIIVYPATPAPGQVTVVVDPEHQGIAIGLLERSLPMGCQLIVQGMEPGQIYYLADESCVKWVPDVQLQISPS